MNMYEQSIYKIYFFCISDVTASMNTYTGTVEDLLEEILRLPDDVSQICLIVYAY